MTKKIKTPHFTCILAFFIINFMTNGLTVSPNFIIFNSIIAMLSYILAIYHALCYCFHTQLIHFIVEVAYKFCIEMLVMLLYLDIVFVDLVYLYGFL